MPLFGEAKKAYQREWMQKRRQQFMADKCCVKCGATESLELDHINPEEKESHNVWSWKKSRREAEISKCQVLCRICHQHKHLPDQPKAIHGTFKRYRKGCRCSECCMARDRNNEYRRAARSPWHKIPRKAPNSVTIEMSVSLLK